MANSKSWLKIFKDHEIAKHDFSKKPFVLSAQDIKLSCQNFKNTAEKEVRILCKQDTRKSRPDIFKKHNLFLLPVKNGFYNIIKGAGYVDIPEIKKKTEIYNSKLNFHLDSSLVGNSEMQHLDFAYASSLIRTFMSDPTLVLTIRGRKYTPKFDFMVGKQKIAVESVQTEVDAGYEGKNQIVLVEAKSAGSNNTIIRQLYYPFRQWQDCTSKKVVTLFFEKDLTNNTYSIWQFKFKNVKDYNSIELVKSGRYRIVDIKNDKKQKMYISISKEHEKNLAEIKKIFAGFDAEASANLMRFSAGDLPMQIIIFVSSAVAGGLAWDLIKLAIKKTYEKFSKARITIKDENSIMYTIESDFTVGVVVTPDRKKEFEHIKNFDDFVKHMNPRNNKE